jgi:hypothetical protein
MVTYLEKWGEGMTQPGIGLASMHREGPRLHYAKRDEPLARYKHLDIG